MSTSKQTTSTQIDPALAAAANKNIGLAGDVAALPYMPNFGVQVAAMSPAQMAAYQGTQQMSGAFGMPTTGTTPQAMGLPDQVQGQNGGTAGYGTQGLYNQMMAGLSPAMQAMLAQFSYNPQTAAGPTNPNMSGTSPISVPGQVPMAMSQQNPALVPRVSITPTRTRQSNQNADRRRSHQSNAAKFNKIPRSY